MTLTDDTVLEEHYEDPRLLQIKLLGEGGTFCFVPVQCSIHLVVNRMGIMLPFPWNVPFDQSRHVAARKKSGEQINSFPLFTFSAEKFGLVDVIDLSIFLPNNSFIVIPFSLFFIDRTIFHGLTC